VPFIVKNSVYSQLIGLDYTQIYHVEAF